MPNPNDPKQPKKPTPRDEPAPTRQMPGDRAPEREPQDLPGTPSRRDIEGEVPGRGTEDEDVPDGGRRDMTERRPHRDL
ncbi:MAG TPA: hypothetical protein VNO33_24070 [Kofleriaceae bacterium]|nr:hypothetical protein [Kofleriaceae bacterium]